MANYPLDSTGSNNSQPSTSGAGDVVEPEIAANLIREKVSRLYASEPNAQQEFAETTETKQLSVHQQFMYTLGTSGKDLATIQTEWHNYYQRLPDHEKHTVWQEFYSSHAQAIQPVSAAVPAANEAQSFANHKHAAAKPPRAKAAPRQKKRITDARSTEEVRAAVRDSVTAGGKLGIKHHIQSLLFGLSMGLLVVIIFLFGFFNEVILAPFYQPSRHAAATPLIVDASSVAPTDKTEVIIPKINVEIPVNYTETSTNEADIENDLESGVVHYPSTTLPGQAGNAAFFGHSSNNIFNKGKYKFAFVLLHTLVPGDTFYLTYGGKVYVYKVITKDIVKPTDVSVLNPIAGQISTATLITCDPPGTSLNRLIIVGQQISPDPTGNPTVTTAAAPVSGATVPVSLPGNGPTLLSHVLKTVFGKTTAIIILVGAILLTFRWMRRPRD
jgi:LPXTG-site transpeptidase (sortase) family protein